MTINPADFVTIVDNPLYPLTPGATYLTGNPDGSLYDEFIVTRQTKTIMGVECVVVRHSSFVDGELHEKTLDYFAQDKGGNVWYFGEDTKEFTNGKVVSTAGTWLAGVDGAEPGIYMLAAPKVGDQYFQENAPGVAVDEALVLSVTENVSVPYGASGGALLTADTTQLEPSLLEHKTYVPGVGLLRTQNVNTGEEEFLLKIKFEGTNGADTMSGAFGVDDLYGYGGNDDLNGKAGADKLYGGHGNDRLRGGADGDVDFLYGGKGDDTIDVAAADQAFGERGDDVFLLSNNSAFGGIDGGGQRDDDLRDTAGDTVKFDGTLDLTAAGISERIAGIETFSMSNGQGGDTLKLGAEDLLDIGDGEFEARLSGGWREGDALRVDGDAGDTLVVADGNWSALTTKHAPAGYDVFQATFGADYLFLLVQQAVTVDFGP